MTTFNDFYCEGNVFDDFELQTNIIPSEHKIEDTNAHETDSDHVAVHRRLNTPFTLYKPLGLSLPSNRGFNSFLASLSTRLSNKFLVTMVVQCPTDLSSEGTSQLSHISGKRASNDYRILCLMSDYWASSQIGHTSVYYRNATCLAPK